MFDVDTCAFNVSNPEKGKSGNKHAGSSLFTLDVDANDTKDLVLGDVSFNNFNLLINNDNSPDFSSSNITAQDSLFPKNHLNTSSVDISNFPAGFYLDVNNDQIKDLIASPNCFSGCESFSSVWYYQNMNATNQPNFNLVTKGFLQDEMIELGQDANPVFFDYNSDGLIDMVIGNHSIFNPLSPTLSKASLFLFENIGSASIPSYQLVDSNYIGISNINLNIPSNEPTKGITPTFGDIDNDGDEDMILGDFNGKLHLFTNSAGTGNTAIFSLTTPEYSGIDVGNFAAPQLIDLNRDLLLDLVIGNNDGTFSYYENDGTPDSPSFTLITDSLGKATTRMTGESNGRSTPYLFDDNGSYKMFSGSSNGKIFVFGDIDGNLDGSFTVLDSAFLGIQEGKHTAIHCADVTNDGRLDMLIGNASGGVAFYSGRAEGVGIKENDIKLNEIIIYPNPTHNSLTIDLRKNELKDGVIRISNLIGKTIHSQKVTQQKNLIDLNEFAPGVYLINFSNLIGNKTYKVIKQ